MLYVNIDSVSKVINLDFELDDNYEVGTTYEDYLDGKWVKLNEEQEAFYNANSSASIKEVFDCVLRSPYEPTIEEVKSLKISQITEYDQSDAVNQFLLGGKRMWLDKDTTVLWHDAMKYVIPIPLALQMLAALELYALDSYNATQEHIAAVKALATKEEVEAYDYTSGYPDKLVFNLNQ